MGLYGEFIAYCKTNELEIPDLPTHERILEHVRAILSPAMKRGQKSPEDEVLPIPMVASPYRETLAVNELLMRVFFIVEHPKGALGGAERQSLFLAQALASRGVDTHMITKSSTPEIRTTYDRGITVHELWHPFLKNGGKVRELHQPSEYDR